ncbi:MAG TPA: transglycosylase domain-containing protein [Acidimicrobiales bacterium]|nr:transglycosylase domain-containing protein [Acidimicrobiales bacterium]
MTVTERQPSASPSGLPPQGSRWPEPGGAPASLWWATLGTTVVAVLIPVIVTLVLLQTLYNPPSGRLPEPRLSAAAQATRIYDGAGNQLAALNRFDTRVPIRPGDLTQVLKDAVVAIEDRRFFQHKGVDMRAIFRALWADLQGGTFEQGGSTITQQYVKRIYTGPQRSVGRKVREAVLASRVEKQLSKDEILFRYLDDIYLGNGAYGVGAASEIYFRKPVREVNLSEAALLAGLIRAPSSDDPRTNVAGAEARRLAVLAAMRDQGKITQSQYDEAALRRIVLATDRSQTSSTATLVYPPERLETTYPYFVDYVRRYLVARYGEDKVYRGGLRVETTIDPRLQAMAEAAVRSTLAGTSPPLEMSLVTVDPNTGYVKAMVGGRDFVQSQVNLALGNCVGAPKPPDGGPVCIEGGGTGRQPGSAFKPFTLAKAFELGITPDRVYSGPSSYTIPRCTGNGCVVRNAEGGGYGALPLRQATHHSVNTVFAQLIQDVGVPETAELAYRMGLTMVRPDAKLGPGRIYGPSLTLGAAEVSPLDMASAFGVFARRGEQFPATPVVRVTDYTGKVLEDNASRRPRRVIAQNIADNVTDVLKGVITSGTGRAADIGRPEGTAGKTGTSEDYSDAWFVGYTRRLSTAVWMGYANSQRPLINVKGVDKVFGGTFPAETWKAFMEKALEGVPDEPFPPPGSLPTSVPEEGERRSRDRRPAPPPVVQLPPEPTVPPATDATVPPITFTPPNAQPTQPPRDPNPITFPPPTTPHPTVVLPTTPP